MKLGQRIVRAREHANAKQRDVAQFFGISSQAISQWESGRTRPDSQRLANLARLLGVRLDWLLDETGPVAFERPPTLTAVRHTTRVPVIDRVKAGDWTGIEPPSVVGSSDEFLVTDLEVSSSTFALVVMGRSMAPEFQPGDKVIIDPKIQPRPGDYVVAKRDEDRQAIFREFQVRSQNTRDRAVIELRSSKPNMPTLSIDRKHPGRIVGTTVEHRRRSMPPDTNRAPCNGLPAQDSRFPKECSCRGS